MLVPDQSQLDVFHVLREVIRKEVLGIDFQEKECKQTMSSEALCMILVLGLVFRKA